MQQNYASLEIQQNFEPTGKTSTNSVKKKNVNVNNYGGGTRRKKTGKSKRNPQPLVTRSNSFKKLPGSRAQKQNANSKFKLPRTHSLPVSPSKKKKKNTPEVRDDSFQKRSNMVSRRKPGVEQKNKSRREVNFS